jgi:antitoxin (DNA-binding transcriptional repressor) of toxin-antitoxin stability system
LVEQGEELEIRKRNVPVARVVPLRRKTARQPLGVGAGTVRIRGKLTEPLIPANVWEAKRRRR